ncbi:MAG: ABC transporter permease [Chloroflexota bacterium]
MSRYIGKRLMLMIPVLLVISFISFLVITLPPGDFVDAYVQRQRELGHAITVADELALRQRYGLDDPFLVQYFHWITGFLTGNLGTSLAMQAPVSRLIWERLPITVLIGALSFVLVNALAIPIAVLSAVRQYSIADYVFTIIGFIGMGIPDFILATVTMWAIYTATGNTNLGIQSPQFVGQPVSAALVLDLVSHLWLPALIAATTGTAATIRTLRANLLDELDKPYVVVARAKGLPRRHLLFRYPVRMAMTPFVVGLAGVLPALVSGELMVSITLGIPSLAPLLLTALQVQDLVLAADILMILAVLSVVGILLSDLMLAMLDPRIRQEA